eukprot:TRINITY_DN27042_c0_g1_i1.p1 TRINITY_DN27042_c0_g1~~TRINITY_DN27042_c0_g1_i1.p1  ORF type:complete len:360 (+),score=58.31 TRINITY_DN27042_c0_g1_i1:46-1125(+)
MAGHRSFIKSPSSPHHGKSNYCGVMFDVVCSGPSAMIHAVHAVTFSSALESDATVFTVLGGYAAEKDSAERWTRQCTGCVSFEPSRLAFSQPVPLTRGDHLGVYIASAHPYCVGVAPARREPVSDGMIMLTNGLMLCSPVPFQCLAVPAVGFIGWVEYERREHRKDFCKAASEALMRDLQEFCLCEDMADVTLIVGSSRLPAHSFILAARSPVFRAMLTHPMREQSTREIYVEGFDNACIEAMLRYVYSGHIEQKVLEDDDSCMALLRAAHKYDLAVLSEACVEALEKRITPETVSDLLLAADDLSIDALKRSCLAFIGIHGADVQDTEGFHRVAERQALILEVISAICPKSRRIEEVI